MRQIPATLPVLGLEPGGCRLVPLNGPMLTFPSIFNIFRSYPLDYCKTVMSEATARIRANPKDAIAYEIRGFARWRVEQFTGAMDDLNKAMSLSSTARNGNAYYVLGECHSQKGDVQVAILDFTKAIDLTPVKSVNFYLRRAQAYSSIRRL